MNNRDLERYSPWERELSWRKAWQEVWEKARIEYALATDPFLREYARRQEELYERS